MKLEGAEKAPGVFEADDTCYFLADFYYGGDERKAESIYKKLIDKISCVTKPNKELVYDMATTSLTYTEVEYNGRFTTVCFAKYTEDSKAEYDVYLCINYIDFRRQFEKDLKGS